MSSTASSYYEQTHPQVLHAHLRRTRACLADPTYATSWPWYSTKPYQFLSNNEMQRRADVLVDACRVPECRECRP